MPLAIFAYQLPDEREEFEQVMRAGRAEAALNEVARKLREKIKYDDGLSDDERKAFDTVQDWIADACDAHDVDCF